MLTERAQGASSLCSGEMEVMLHRRTLLDDWRGVAEPINETLCGCRDCYCAGLIARGQHWFTLQVCCLEHDVLNRKPASVLHVQCCFGLAPTPEAPWPLLVRYDSGRPSNLMTVMVLAAQYKPTLPQHWHPDQRQLSQPFAPCLPRRVCAPQSPSAFGIHVTHDDQGPFMPQPVTKHAWCTI